MKLAPLSSLRRDQSGLAYAAAVTFISLVVIAITWNIFGPALESKVFNYSEEQMKEDGTWDDFKDTHALILFIWRTWPVFLLLGAIIYLLMASQRGVHETGVYGA